jgi:hypothetical protein
MIDDSVSEAPAAESGASKVYIPLASVSTEDGVAPEIGDEVEFSVKGSVESLEGDVACVIPSEINGQPAPDAMAEEEMPEADHDELMRMAEKEDGMGGY